MFELTKTFIHETGFKITPFYMEGQGFIFLPKELENQVGYENLAHAIIDHDSFTEGIEYIILRDSKLLKLKDLLRIVSSTDYPSYLSLYESLKYSNSLILLTEAGLYTVMILSRKPNAVAFRRWITCEVLPTIREKGFYQKPAMNEKLSTMNSEKFPTTERIEVLLHRIVDNFEEQRQLNQETSHRLDQIEAVLSDCKRQYDPFIGWKKIKTLVDDMTEIYELTPEDRRRYFHDLCQEHDIRLPEKAILATEPLYCDAGEIAHQLGIYSTHGKPHLLLISALIRHLKLDQEKYCRKFPFVRGTCRTMMVKYSSQVVVAIHQWLKDNDFPEKISLPWGKSGKERKFEVKYRKQK